jgi:hypothetical protein
MLRYLRHSLLLGVDIYSVSAGARKDVVKHSSEFSLP